MSAPSLFDAPVAMKGDLTSAYLAGGTDGRGLLPAEVASNFLQATANESEALGMFNQDYMGMTAPQSYIDVAGFSGRVSFADVPGVATTEEQRSSLTISRAKLEPEWFRAASQINYRVQKENIARMGIGDFVMMDLRRQVLVDIEEAIWESDTDGSDDGLNLIDGLIKQAVARTLNAGQAAVTVNDYPFYACLQTMGKPFRRDKANLRFICSDSTEAAYWNYLTQNRGNVMASIYENEAPGGRIRLQGIKVQPFAMFPDNYIMMTNLQNICPGFLLEMYVEQKHDPDPGVDMYFFRYAFDVKFAQSTGVVMWQGLDLGVDESL